MLFPIPMQVSNLRHTGVQTQPVASVVLIILNVLGYLLLSPLAWAVGPNSAPWTVLTYGFVHIGWWHVLINVWYLWVFGNPVNRRIGNGYYLATYLGTILLIGIVGRLILPGFSVGASGAVFAIIAMMGLLMPSAKVEVHYIAFFPITIVMGLLKRPSYWLFWIVRWGTSQWNALALCTAYPLFELCAMLFGGLSWTNLGHLGGFVCGVGAVLLLPTSISMGRRR